MSRAFSSGVNPALLARYDTRARPQPTTPTPQPETGIIVQATAYGEALSVNAMYANSERGRVLTQKGKDWKARLASDLAGLPHLPEQPYAVLYRLYGHWETAEGKPRIRDGENCLKGLSDSLAYALRVDDKWFYSVTVEKYHAEQARVEIEVRLWSR